ncbi:enoyl-CoA hydratase/carnithine racemase [Amaricoccus macauensis]|uniref:3-hydroxyisobutyryl-CoA hydrolase n=1 Tax=Amaricoccus macauensis TaxID=57001 RepID=A0A840SR98_9RHOB|nr:enoyl-CoA hydratase/carnithine racemase [Amaricoccus macauensis]
MGDISIRVEGRAGRITLNRPRALNALTHAMANEIAGALDAWEADAGVDLVMIDGEGERAFCAGGDIVETWRAGRAGDFGSGRRFWADEYRMNARIAGYPKPYVAFMHGFTMGGGVGVSGHGSHRIVCETTQVAMPECGIGLIPDVGGTHLLSRAPGHLGEYLGLTSARMSPGDAIHAGFADRFVPGADWGDLKADLIRTGDVGRIPEHAAPEAPLAARQEAIDDAFEAADLASIVARLEASDWGHEVLKALRRNSPLSMASTLTLVRAARRCPGIGPALRREFRFSWRASESGDLLEGIRAQVIDKDRNPTWRDDLDGVRPDDVAAMLAPLGEDELVLPEH